MTTFCHLLTYLLKSYANIQTILVHVSQQSTPAVNTQSVTECLLLLFDQIRLGHITHHLGLVLYSDAKSIAAEYRPIAIR